MVSGVPGSPSRSHIAVTTYQSVGEGLGSWIVVGMPVGNAGGLLLAGPATVAYPNMTGPSTCKGNVFQSMLQAPVPAQEPPHIHTRLADGFGFGYHDVSVVEMLAYCCVSAWYASWATRMLWTMLVASVTCDDCTSLR